MTERQPFPGLSSHDAQMPARVSGIVNNMLLGRLNVVLDVTVLEAGGAPKTVKDVRIHANSFILPMNFSATPVFNITATRDGEADISWTGSSWTTRDIRLLIIG